MHMWRGAKGLETDLAASRLGLNRLQAPQSTDLIAAATLRWALAESGSRNLHQARAQGQQRVCCPIVVGACATFPEQSAAGVSCARVREVASGVQHREARSA
jgi:hypothetical protein